MQPIDKKELETLIEEAKAAGKDTSELEKILTEKQLVKPVMGETKVEDIEKKVLMMTDKGEKMVQKKGKRVIISTGPANEEDFR
jgi:uncharacterized protein YjgD (DUF1641 family)